MLVMTLKEISRLMQKRHVSPVELLASCFRRIEDTRTLNAYVTVNSESAMAQAEDSHIRHQNGKPRSILDGVPVAIKDNFCTKGVRTTCGSRMLENFVPTYDATVVQKLKDAGAVILGKTNMDEFAMGNGTTDSIFGPTKNVWRSGLPYALKDSEAETGGLEDGDWFVAGGSSGGSAVAVATGSCFGALGSDTGGSTRNPASYCGLVGYKPTYGILSRHGLIPLVNSLDVPGIFGRSVEDVAAIFNVLRGQDTLDSTSWEPVVDAKDSSDPVHVGIPEEYHCNGLSPEVVSEWSRVSDLLESNGALLKRVSLPHTEHSIACYSVLNQCEVASNMARYDGLKYGHRAKDVWGSTELLYATTRSQGFGDIVRGRILAGNYFLLRSNYGRYFVQAMRVRRLISDDFRRVFEADDAPDVLLTPVTLSSAHRHSLFSQKDSRQHTAVEDFCTQPVNMAGLPAITLPTGLSQEGTPLGLQLIGRFGDDLTLLRVAQWVQDIVQFPPLCLRMGPDWSY